MGDIARTVRVVFDSSGVVRAVTDVEKSETKAADATRKLAEETNKIQTQYQRVASALDPVISGEIKYANASRTLDDALRRGIVTQQQHMALLDKAKTKYIESGGEVTKFSTLIGKVTELTELGGRSLGEMGEKLDNIHSKFSAVTGVAEELGPLLPLVLGLAAGVGVLAIAFEGFEFLKSVIEEGIKTQIVVDQLNNSLRSTGASAGYSAKELIEHAEALVNVTGRSKDAIVAGELILTRFDKLGHDVLPRATQAALDYAQANNKDLPTAFTTVGALLEGNAKSLLKLKDIGGVFSAGQRAMLTDMVNSGHIAEYQSKVFELLTDKVGGAAAAYANSLAGGIAISQQKMVLFKETIASEILPPLQTLFDGLLRQVGGWELVDYVVKGTAHDIGDAIRTMVYDAIILYHSWEEAQSNSVASLETGLKSFVDFALNSVTSLLEGFKSLPSLLGGGDDWNAPIAAVKSLQSAIDDTLSSSIAGEKQLALQHEAEANIAIKALNDHKQALEGNDKVEKNHGSVLDDIASKTKSNTSALNEAAKAVQAYDDKYGDLIRHQSEAIISEGALLEALSRGVNVYNVVRQEQERSNAVDAATTQLYKEHRAELEKLVSARDALSKAGKSAAASAVQQSIDQANAAYLRQSAILARLVGQAVDIKQATTLQLAREQDATTYANELSKAESDLADAKDNSTRASYDLATQLEIESRIRKLTPNSSTDIISIVLETAARRDNIRYIVSEKDAILSQRSGYREIATLRASLLDQQGHIDATNKWGAEVEKVLSKYNLLDDVAKQLAIHFTALDDARVKNGSATLAQVELELTKRQQEIDLTNTQAAQQDIRRAQILDFISTLESGFSAVSTILQGTDSNIGKFAADLGGLAAGISKLQQSGKAFSIAWAQSMASAIASSESLIKDLNIGGSNKTGGSSALGGRLESNYAGTGSLIGSILGGIIAGIVSEGTATGVGVALGGAIGGVLGSLISKAGDSASAHLSQSGSIVVGEVSKQLAGSIYDALTNILTGLKNELASLGLQLQGIPLVDIKVRDNIVRVVVGNVVRTFSSMQDAISFGIAEAVKQAATTGGHLPPEVLAALKHTTATNIQQLQGDIDFAMKIANYGIPQVAQTFSKSISDFFVEFQRDIDLGIDTTKSIANLADTIQKQKDAILGTNRNLSPADQIRSDAAAFNERESLVKAEQQLDLANNQVKRADLQQQIALLKSQAQIDRGHIELGKGRAEADAATDAASASSLSLLLGSLAAIDNAIKVEQAVIDSIILISDKEIADAIKHIGKVGKGVGKSGADDAQTVRDALEQQRISLLGEEGQALANIAAKYDNLNKKAGKNADLLTKIADAREKEIAALTKQVQSQYITPNLGGKYDGSRSQYTQTLLDQNGQEADLIKNAKALHLSLVDIASAFHEMGRILGLQVASDLGIQSATLQSQYEKEGQSLSFLTTHMDELGVSSSQLAGYLSELSDATELSIFGKIQQYITDEKTLASYKEVQYELDIARAKEELSLAYAAGVITLEAYNRLGEIIYSLPSTVPDSGQHGKGSTATTVNGNGNGSDLQSSAANTQLQAAQTNKAAADKLTQWQQSLLTNPETSPLAPRQQVEESRNQLDALLAKALSGDTSARDQFTSSADAYLKLFASTFGRTGAYASEVLSLSAEAEKIKSTIPGNPGQNLAVGDFTKNTGYAASGPQSGAVQPTITLTEPPSPPARDVHRNPASTAAGQDATNHIISIDTRLGKDGDLYRAIHQSGTDAATHYVNISALHHTTNTHLSNISDDIASMNSYLRRTIEALRRVA